MRIAVDVMGGDHGCGVVIEGAKRALQADERIRALYLVGNRTEIHAALPQRGFRDHRVRVVHASEVLTMTTSPRRLCAGNGTAQSFARWNWSTKAKPMP